MLTLSTSSVDIPYDATPVTKQGFERGRSSPIVLCACYAIPSTDIHSAIVLVCCAMPGTANRVYAAIGSRACLVIFRTEKAYALTTS
eukprot:2876808-Rhodomonas_salina.3